MNTAFIGELYIPQTSLFLSVLCVCVGDQPSCAETANPQVSVTGAVVCTRLLACFCNTGLDCNCHDTFPKFISKCKQYDLNTNTSMAKNKSKMCTFCGLCCLWLGNKAELWSG